jgi:hypothetical protein
MDTNTNTPTAGYKAKPNIDGSYTEYVTFGPSDPMPKRLRIESGYTVMIQDFDPIRDGYAGRVFVEWKWAGSEHGEARSDSACWLYPAEIWPEARLRAFEDVEFICDIIAQAKNPAHCF